MLVSSRWSDSFCGCQLSPEGSRCDRLSALYGHLPLVCKLVAPHWLGSRCWQSLRVRISATSPSCPSTTLSPTSSAILVRYSIVETRDIDPSRISPCIFRQVVRMSLELMRLEIDFRFKDDKFLLQAFPIRTQEMISAEMFVQCVVVLIILLQSPFISSVADMASFVPVSTMGIKLVITVEPLNAEATLRMSFETALIDCSRIIVSKFLMFSKFLQRE